MSHRITPEQEAELIRRGAKVTYMNRAMLDQPKADEPEPAKPVLVEAGVAVSMNVATGEVESLVALLPVVTKSEINLTKWYKRSQRTHATRRVMSKVLGPHLRSLATFAEAYHAGRALLVTFTRLGGRRMDQSNLPSACKGTEDMVALMLGADDGDARWHPRFEQRPGGSVGVEVKLELFPT